MDRLVGYGSDDDTETDRFDGGQQSGTSTSGSGSTKRREDTDNYDDVNMDMSEDSQSQAESEPELPPADAPPKPSREERKQSDNRLSNRERDGGGGERRRRDDRHDSRDPRERRDDYKYARSDRDRERRGDSSRRSHDRSADAKVPSQDEKPFTGDNSTRSYDARDAASPRFVDRDRRDRDRRERGERAGRDHRDRHSQRNDRRHERRRSRSRERSQPKHSGDSHSSGSSERRSPTGGDNYRPSYKVNKKLEVMEKMGLQIKTPDGTMATAQQLRRAAGEGGPAAAAAAAAPLPGYYNPGTVNTTKILDQVAKRKLLWSGKKSEAEEAAKWSGAKFSHDTDGKQTNKFMRLMGIKDPHAVQAAPDKAADPVKKQEELFQAMQAQYEVARATTHTMRGVGLGFSRQPL